jgi:hypothetical protein
VKRAVSIFLVTGSLLVTGLLLIAGACLAQDSVDARWKDVQFLLGNWTATKTPAGTTGSFSFQTDLVGRVIIRRNFSQVENGPRHEDLLVIYADGPDSGLRAAYFDSEGHAIRYKVTSPAPNQTVFDSEGDGPRYRLSYWMAGKELKGKFEVEGKTYLEWASVKASAKKENMK